MSKLQTNWIHSNFHEPQISLLAPTACGVSSYTGITRQTRPCGDCLIGHREGKGRTPKLNPTHVTRKSQSQSAQALADQEGEIHWSRHGPSAEPQVGF